MLRVTYKGTNDALRDLLGGRLDFLVAAVDDPEVLVSAPRRRPGAEAVRA